jgi:hypothetical protein
VVAEAAPNEVAAGRAEADEPPAEQSFQALAARARRAFARIKPPAPLRPPPPVAPVAVEPGIERVVRFGQRVYSRTTDPVFVFPDAAYPSYTDVRRLVELSGFEAYRQSDTPFIDGGTYIHLSPEQPYRTDPALRLPTRAIWWSLEYGGEYEPDLSNWRGDVWASDPAWAKAHGAKFVLLGSHPDLKPPELSDPSRGEFDYLMLAYQTQRRQVIQQQLADLRTPSNPYPGYGMERHHQLCASRLMLHVHQGEWQAIAPQRIALAAAYKLPVVHEDVPNVGEYGKHVAFASYNELQGFVRGETKETGVAARERWGADLHHFLCVENTFRACVERALS